MTPVPAAAPAAAARAPRSTRPVPARAALAAPVLALGLLLTACGQPATPGAGGDGGTSAPGDPAATAPGPSATGTTTPLPSPTQATPDPLTSATPGTLPADFAADLSVALDDGAGTATTSDLTCADGGAAGTVPDPAAACAALAAAGTEALEAPSGDAACTLVFGGPQTAVVSGTLRGEPVSADLSRSDGCEIARWDALVPLVPAVGGPDS